MDRLVNTALTAMRGAMSRQATIANNLANANTTGFRAEIANASTLWINGQTYNRRAQSTEQVLGADMKQGSVTHTGNALDVAINDQAMLAVQAVRLVVLLTARLLHHSSPMLAVPHTPIAHPALRSSLDLLAYRARRPSSHAYTQSIQQSGSPRGRYSEPVQ